MKHPVVGIIMGSKSDLRVMAEAAAVLDEFGIPNEVTIVSAHRTPKRMLEYGAFAIKRGLKVIVAGAGGAAHLPGMIASVTTLPVIGVPIKSSNSLDGLDSLLSIAQMPGGVPVATVAVNGAKNAGILAAEILSLNDEKLTTQLQEYKDSLRVNVEKSAIALESNGLKKFLEAAKK